MTNRRRVQLPVDCGQATIASTDDPSHGAALKVVRPSPVSMTARSCTVMTPTYLDSFDCVGPIGRWR
jgi:hypothetical protein